MAKKSTKNTDSKHAKPAKRTTEVTVKIVVEGNATDAAVRREVDELLGKSKNAALTIRKSKTVKQ